MFEELLPVDHKAGIDPEEYLRLWREKWGDDSPANVIGRAWAECMVSGARRFEVDSLNKGDLLAAYEAASWIVASLGQLQEIYGSYHLSVGNGDGSQAIHRQFLEDVAWFSYNLHTQASAGDWQAIAAVDLELASVRTAPARTGRRRQVQERVRPEMPRHASSMAALVAEFHLHAAMTIFDAGGMELLNVAMRFVPTELQRSGEDCPAFAQTVAAAWNGRRLGEYNCSGWKPGWLQVYDQLKDSADFQKAATDLRMPRVLEFCRGELREFSLADRIRAELKLEFAKAAQARLAAALPLGDPAASKRVGPRTPGEERERLVSQYLDSHPNPKREDVARSVGCSVTTLLKVPAWQRFSAARHAKRKTRSPATVELSEKVLATQGQGKKDEILNRLIEEQEADFEPSPITDDPPDEKPRRVYRQL
jgi:transposase-like protein